MLKNKDNLTLLLALAIPIVFILILVGYLYITPLIFKPKTNFIYYFNQSRNVNRSYAYNIINGKLDAQANYSSYSSSSQTDQTEPQPNYIFPEIYLYDVQTNESKVITLNEAKLHNYIKGDFSPDGFEVIDGSDSSGGGLFYSGSSRYDEFFLKKNGYSKKINVSTDNNNNSYYNFELIGWIKN